ncbi:MAG: hypothetical protein AMJ89_00670 [candidate division Zixibacteria bacterium SM23_73]|nr:MAG: hypothetical protein AMJ89_00670 [candidate division Zixibacteria bacterium SM23_73]
MFSKGTKKRVLSERGNFLKKTHLKSFPNCLKLFSKDAIFSLKEGGLWRNFYQDTVRQAHRPERSRRTEFVQIADSKR